MTYHPKTDPNAIVRLRVILAHEEFLGSDALRWTGGTATDDEIRRYAEAMMNTTIGVMTKARLALYDLADATFGQRRWWLVGRRSDGPWERLMRETE